MLSAMEWALAALGAGGCVLAIVAGVRGNADRFAAQCERRRGDMWFREGARVAAERDALAARLTRKPSVMAMRREKVAETTAILRAEVEARG